MRSVSPSSSRFRGDIPIEKSREAVGHGHRNNQGSQRWLCRKGLPVSQRHQKAAVTHVGCCRCRLRFTPAAAAYLAACPECGQPPQPIVGAEGVVGFRLFVVEDVPHDLPEAVAVSIPIPDQARGRS